MRGEDASSKICSIMDKLSSNLKQGYVDCLGYLSKITCIIHGLGHLSDGFKLLHGFADIYVKGRPFKDRSPEPTSN